jgi:anti-sigma regulatory factor (Ser/Thr protein kinase)
VARAEGKPSETSAQQQRGRAAALRDEAHALRRESALLQERSELITDLLVSTLLETERLPPAETEERFSLRAARVRAAVRLVRARLRSWLERSGVGPEDTADILLACSEACANAVEHPVEPKRHLFEVEARQTPTEIELAVRDFGTWREDQSEAFRGRGLRMIRALMDATEIVTAENETTTVMRRARRPAA